MNTRINLKMVAFILGIFLWIYVNMVLSPIVRRSFTASVETRNLPPLMRVALEDRTVVVVLDGSRRNFILAGPNAIQASVDLYNIRPGLVQIPIRVNAPPGMTVVSVKPAQIEVQAEMLTVKSYEVSAEVLGQTAEGFIAEPPVVNPRRVKIEGPPDLIERITGCKVSIFLQDIKNSYSEAKPVTVFTAEGELSAKDALKIQPDKVTVDILVKEGFPTRVVPVASPTFINKPPEGLRLASFTLSPANVTISGPQRALKQVNEISALPIDLSPMTASATVVGLLKAPMESVRIVGTPTVMIEIALERVQVIRAFRGLALTMKNSPNQHCVGPPSSYTLVLRGFVEDLDKVRPNDLGITLDVRGNKPGTYPVELTSPPALPEKVTTLEIQPRQVEVVISEISATEPGHASGSTHSP